MRKLFIGVGLLVLFFTLGFFATHGLAGLSALDDAVNTLFAHIRTTGGVKLMLSLTKLGEPKILTPIIGISFILFLCLRRWKIGLVLAISVWIVNISTAYMKNFFSRPRPHLMFGPAGGFSFPSGHVSASAIVLLIVAIGLASLITNRTLRILSSSVCALYIIIVCVSRLYLNVHWFTDVVGGVLLSAGVAYALFGISRLIEHRKSRGGYSD